MLESDGIRVGIFNAKNNYYEQLDESCCYNKIFLIGLSFERNILSVIFISRPRKVYGMCLLEDES